MAAWSALSYILGLGDRHLGNIMLKTDNAEIIHIDFDCIFHKGRVL